MNFTDFNKELTQRITQLRSLEGKSTAKIFEPLINDNPKASRLLLKLIETLERWPFYEKPDRISHTHLPYGLRAREDEVANEEMDFHGYILRPDLVETILPEFQPILPLLESLKDAKLIKLYEGAEYHNELEGLNYPVITFEKYTIIECLELRLNLYHEDTIKDTQELVFQVGEKVKKSGWIDSIDKMTGYPCVIRLQTKCVDNGNDKSNKRPSVNEMKENGGYYQQLPEIRIKSPIPQEVFGMQPSKYRETPDVFRHWQVEFSGIVEKDIKTPAFIAITDVKNVRLLQGKNPPLTAKVNQDPFTHPDREGINETSEGPDY